MATSCAEREVEDYDILENNSLRAWMDKNYDGPYDSWEQDPNWKSTDSGLYIYSMRHSDGEAVADTTWVRISYTGKTLDGNIFYTRNAGVAKRQGTFSRRTHYVDDFVYLYEENASLPKGMSSSSVQ